MTFTECPRCHDQTLHADEPALNALSRRDDKTYICPACGDEEAFIDSGLKKTDNREIDFCKTHQH